MSYLLEKPEEWKKDYLVTLGLPVREKYMGLLSRTLPVKWMDRCIRYYNESDFANSAITIYTSDEGMGILNKYREKTLTKSEMNTLKDVDIAIMNGPRPDKPFVCFRGIHDPIDVKPGDIVTFPTPKSASFNLEDVGEGYIRQINEPTYDWKEIKTSTGVLRLAAHRETPEDIYGYYIWIDVPTGIPCLYAESENQIVFPTGARFVVVEEEHMMSIASFGEMSESLGYRWRYIGV